MLTKPIEFSVMNVEIIFKPSRSLLRNIFLSSIGANFIIIRITHLACSAALIRYCSILLTASSFSCLTETWEISFNENYLFITNSVITLIYTYTGYIFLWPNKESYVTNIMQRKRHFVRRRCVSCLTRSLYLSTNSLNRLFLPSMGAKFIIIIELLQRINPLQW